MATEPVGVQFNFQAVVVRMTMDGGASKREAEWWAPPYQAVQVYYY